MSACVHDAAMPHCQMPGPCLLGCACGRRRCTFVLFPSAQKLHCGCRYPLSILAQALGCLLYNMAYGQLPFPTDAKLQILNGDYVLPDSRGSAIANLIRDLLQVVTL